MKTKREKQLEIALLKEKIENLSGKKVIFKESMRGAKTKYLDSGKISEEDFEKLLKMDKTPTKKYIEWICKIYLSEKPEEHELSNTIDEFDAFVVAKKIEGEEKNIEKYKTFEELKTIVDKKNQEGSTSKTQKSNEYKIVINDPNLFIVVPFNHEASRKVGFKWFATKKNSEGVMDCPWCIGNKNDTHWESYWNNLNTFYYVQVKGNLLKEITENCGNVFSHCAIQISTNEITVWDKNDKGYSVKSTKQGKSYMEILEGYLVENNLVEKFSNI